MQSLCVIAHSPGVTAKLTQDLQRVFCDYIRVQGWSLDQTEIPPEGPFELYLASFPSVLKAVSKILDARGEKAEMDKLMLAKRILSPVYFNRLLQLATDTRVLIAGNSELACSVLFQAMMDFGIRHLQVSFHYPGHLVEKNEDIHTAIVTGVNKWIPEWITNVIDVGAKGIALTTYNRIIHSMGIPEHLLDEISKHYTIPIFGVTRRYYEESNKVTALLQCIEDAVFTIDADGYVDIRNKVAESIFGDASGGRPHINSVFPELQLSFPLHANFSLRDAIASGKGQHYILQIESIGETLGAVVLARQVRRVQELEGIVRTELKPRRNTTRYTFEDIFTRSQELQHTITLARRFAATRSTILLEGESGVGKEMFAHAIHAASERADKPFVAINLAAMPEALAESELFGYVDGAFTGAKKGGRRGLFEEAHQGTLFLDEIGDAPLLLQSKLLRVLEEKEIRRVGGASAIPVDVRIIAATNKPLGKMTQDGEFRTDLFYRLCACPLSIPPLRARKQDVLPLMEYFSRRAEKPLRLDERVQRFLSDYAWPGNVRELNNIVNYVLNMNNQGESITIDTLPRYLFGTSPLQEAPPAPKTQGEEQIFAANRDILASRGWLQSACEALLCLNAEHEKHLGRETLLNALAARGVAVSMYSLRQCLKQLDAWGLVVVGTSRQGCLGTPKGRRFLSWLSAQPSD